MDVLAEVIVIGLAAFAVSYVIRYTAGPFDSFVRLREYLGVEAAVAVFDGNETVYQTVDMEPTKFFGKLVTCYWCLTTWVALFILGGYILETKLIQGYMVDYVLFIWFASIGLSGLLHEIVIND